MKRLTHKGGRKAAKTTAKKTRTGRSASTKKPGCLAELEKLRLMEDEIVAKHLASAPEYITAENGERIKVDKAELENVIREDFENKIRLYILIHDLNCTDPNDMSPSPLRDRVMYFKNTEEGRASLMEIAEAKLRKDKLRKGKKKGARHRHA